MSMQLLFSKNFLSHIINDFKLSDVPNIRRITLEIKILIEELETGKFESLKEEEVKSRYINTFFGDILGFNGVNPDKWLLREEKKSTVDGTKPDAVLGYFFREKEKDKVKAVIELKDAGTELDTEQKRPGKQTAVDQAFEYVAKMGGVCKWVIVSNIKEIRFYPSLDRSKFQGFYLRELKEESKLKELLFLFHKDRLSGKKAYQQPISCMKEHVVILPKKINLFTS